MGWIGGYIQLSAHLVVVFNTRTLCAYARTALEAPPVARRPCTTPELLMSMEPSTAPPSGTRLRRGEAGQTEEASEAAVCVLGLAVACPRARAPSTVSADSELVVEPCVPAEIM